MACVIDKSSRGAKLKRAFEELPMHYSREFGGIHIDNTRSQNVVQIEGLTKTEWSGFINLILSGKDSFISGAMESIRYTGSSDGFIYLTLENGATWNVLGKLFKNPCSQAELNKIVPFGFSLQRQKMVFFCH